MHLSVALLFVAHACGYASTTAAAGAAPGAAAAAAAAHGRSAVAAYSAAKAVRLRLGSGRSSSCCSSSRRSCGAEVGGIGSRARFGTPPPPLPQPATLLGRPARRRGQCLMGVAGLTGYINKNLKGAVAMEDLREVRATSLQH